MLMVCTKCLLVEPATAIHSPNSNNRQRRLIDAYLRELKNASNVANHLAARHPDHEWRAAATEVASACSKYQDHFFSSQATYQKLRSLHRKLQTAEAGDAEGRQLSRLLLQTFKRQGTPMEDGVSRYVCLEADDSVKFNIRQLWQQERELVDCIAGRLADPAYTPIMDAAPFVSKRQTSVQDEDSSTTLEAKHLSRMDSAVGERPQGASAASVSSESPATTCLEPPDTSSRTTDSVLEPLCRWIELGGGEESAGPRPVVVLTRSNAATLLRRHPNPQLRRSVILHGSNSKSSNDVACNACSSCAMRASSLLSQIINPAEVI